MRRKVKRIIDGDTFEVIVKVQGCNFIRLAGVNAPEKGTKAGMKAMRVLKGMIGGRTVTLHPVARSYDRIVAEVICDRKSVNKRMRERGY